MNHETLTIIASILVPMIGGFFWLVGRMYKGLNSLNVKIDEIHKDLRNIDSRLSRLEGGFTERGYWESRDKKIGE